MPIFGAQALKLEIQFCGWIVIILKSLLKFIGDGTRIDFKS